MVKRRAKSKQDENNKGVSGIVFYLHWKALFFIELILGASFLQLLQKLLALTQKSN